MKNIIQKDGKYYQIGYPVLLPCDKMEPNITIWMKDDIYGIASMKESSNLVKLHIGYIPYHLYILSDEEIKELP